MQALGACCGEEPGTGAARGRRTGGGQLAAISSPAAWGGSSIRSEGGSPWREHADGSAVALTLESWAGVRNATQSAPQTTARL